MTLRIKLLAAAALALPATMASAQQTAPTAPPPPMGTAVPPQPVIPPAETPVPSTAEQPAQPAETVPDVAEEAADAVEADAVAQTRVQAAAQGQTPTATTPPPATAAPTPTPAPAAPAQAQAQPPAQPATTGAVALATAADLRTGVQVRDQQGGLVGTVETADAGGAVVNTGAARARLALSSFGRNSQGLVIAMTKAQFEAAASAANPS